MTKPSKKTTPAQSKSRPIKTVPARGEMSASIAGHPVKLVPSFENISAVEDATGCGLYELTAMFREGRLNVRQCGTILGLVATPPVSPEDFRAEVEASGLARISGLIGGFLVAAITGGEDLSKQGGNNAGKRTAAKS